MGLTTVRKPPQGASAAPRRGRSARWHNQPTTNHPPEIYGNLWESLGILEKTSQIYGNPSKIYGNPGKNLTNLWESLEIYGNPGKNLTNLWESLENLWESWKNPHKFMGTPRKYMGITEFLLKKCGGTLKPLTGTRPRDP